MADRRMLQAIAKVLDKRINSAEREVYRSHLLLGGPLDRTAGGQALLAAAMDSTLDDQEWTLSSSRVRNLAKQCRVQGGAGAAVAERLERIHSSELLLAPAAAIFGLILSSDGQTIAELSRVVRRQWGSSVRTIDVNAVASLETELRDSTGEPESGKRWVQIAHTLASGDYEQAIGLLMEQNSSVMKYRAGSAPWVDVTNGRLRVKFRDDGAELPKGAALPEYWRHSYFLDSLRSIALALRV